MSREDKPLGLYIANCPFVEKKQVVEDNVRTTEYVCGQTLLNCKETREKEPYNCRAKAYIQRILADEYEEAITSGDNE